MNNAPIGEIIEEENVSYQGLENDISNKSVNLNNKEIIQEINIESSLLNVNEERPSDQIENQIAILENFSLGEEVPLAEQEND